jgi:putative membrane protein
MHTKFVRALACTALMLTLSLFAFAQSAQEKGGSKSGSGADMSQEKSPKTSSDMSQDKTSKSAEMSQGKSSGQLSTSDKQFLTKAAQGGEAEVELGQLAQQKSQDPKVKEFAKRMVDDHSKANEKLKSLASSKGVDLPSQPDAKEKAEKERLSKLSGEQFDRAYMKHMLKDHEKDVSEFRKEAQAAKDPDVKQFASSTLPTLEDHLKQAQSIAPKENAEAKSGKTSDAKSGKSKSAKTSSTSASNPPQQ